jgi:hypothetical protein
LLCCGAAAIVDGKGATQQWILCIGQADHDELARKKAVGKGSRFHRQQEGLMSHQSMFDNRAPCVLFGLAVGHGFLLKTLRRDRKVLASNRRQTGDRKLSSSLG